MCCFSPIAPFKLRLLIRRHKSLDLARWLYLITALALCSTPSAGHVMSLSNGELYIEGSNVIYKMHMPLYEIAHLKNPRKTLLENFHVRDGDQHPEPKNAHCEEDKVGGWYTCRAEFHFSKPVEQLDVECRFSDVIVPNHIHLLRSELGDTRKQTVFDFSLKKTTINFMPPTAAEVIWSDFLTGFTRVIIGPVQILFILGLTLAGRNRSELSWLAIAFLLSESVSALIFSAKGWQPSAQFVEAAGALTVIYLAVEILLLPEAGYRWIVAALMGVFHGFYFSNFLIQSSMDPGFFLMGISLAALVLLSIFYLFLSRIEHNLPHLHPTRVGSCALLAVGAVWFLLRLRS